MLFFLIQILLLCVLITSFYLIFMGVLYLNFSFLPPILEGLITILMTFLISYFMSIIILALINTIARMLMRNKEGEIGGFDLILWAIQESSFDIAYTISQKLFIHSPFPDWIYTLFGLKKNTGVSILTRIWDPDLVEIGENTLIGTNSMITAHHIRNNKLFRKRIKIGSNCTIGILSIILPGAKIGNNVMISAGSLVPANWELENNSIYSGVPVRKIKEVKSFSSE